MRWYVRIVFGLNAAYQVVIGLVALLAPLTMLGLYGASDADKQVLFLHAAMRGLGFYILFGGVLSALVALDPDRHPVLLALMGTLAVLTIVGWSLTLAFGEMQIGQVGVDLVVQALLLVGALGYYATAKRAAAAKP
jgi:hypothetical protein